MATALGYGQTAAPTVAILTRLEVTPPTCGERPNAVTARTSHADSLHNFAEYKNFIRQLPATTFTEKLIVIFLREFNWQYYVLDVAHFRTQFREWSNIPYSVYGADHLQGVSLDLAIFPAVLFQVVAIALLMLSDEEAEEFASLKYSTDMTMADLACDYSSSGEKMVAMFSKRDLSMTTVQAEFLSACFFKLTAKVAESVCWPPVLAAANYPQARGAS